MKLWINQLLQWLPKSETTVHIERILWIDSESIHVVSIELNNPNAIPIWHKYLDLETALATGEVQILQIDPFTSLHRKEDTIPASHRQRRDQAWKIIAPLIQAGESLYIPQERGKLIMAAVQSSRCTKRTIYRYLRRYWQGGQTPNALLPLFDRCGGRGKERQTSNHKRGRPSQLDQISNATKGINVDTQIRQLLVRGAKLFHEKQGLPLTIAYQRTLEQFFNTGYSYKNGVLEPILVPPEQRPSFRQFEYWYKKDRDLVKSLISRAGQRRFNLNYREILGSSSQMAKGPGSLWQIDATIGDIYLVSRFDRHRIIGRPIIYLVVDTFSRMIVGFSVSLEGPSWLGAMLALENATKDKVEFGREYGIEISYEQWPCHHLPEAILADRGELLSTKADNLVNALGIQIANTPPYRPDWKPIVERQFRLLNEEVIHWVPGAVYQPRERGEQDYRLDAVLDIHQFRVLMIHLILHYNYGHWLCNYPLDNFMIADGVEPYPVALWQWGIENRGHPRVTTPEIVRLNLLPTATATVTERGIRFEKLFYTCDLAAREQWFVKARVGKTWKITVAYDPRNLDKIYLPLNNGLSVEVCQLLDTCQTFKGKDWYEAVDYWIIQKLDRNQALSSTQQAQASLHAQINQIINQATEQTQIALSGKSPKSRLKNLRTHRKSERDYERQAGASPLVSHHFPDSDEPIIEPEWHQQPQVEDEEYIPIPNRLDQLRIWRDRSWNDE